MEPSAPLPDPTLPANVQPAAAQAGAGSAARLARLVALRALRWPYRAGRALWPHRFALTVTVALLALSGWLAAQLYWPGARPVFGAAPAAASAEPAAAVAFLDAQEHFDGATMWAALSPQAQQQLMAGGQSQLSWQARADMEQRVGLRYAGHTFAGAAALPDGGTMAFYLVKVQAAGKAGAQIVPIAFRVGPDGKILSIGNVS